MTFDDGTTSIGVGTLNGSGVATFSTSTLNVAGSPHTISAVYGGDSNFTDSTSNSLTQTVTKATTTTSLTASTGATHDVRDQHHLHGHGDEHGYTGTLASGTVTFDDGTTSIGVGTLTQRRGHVLDQHPQRLGQPAHDQRRLRRRQQLHRQHVEQPDADGGQGDAPPPA